MQRRELLTTSFKTVAGTSLLARVMLGAPQESAGCAPCSAAPFPRFLPLWRNCGSSPS